MKKKNILTILLIILFSIACSCSKGENPGKKVTKTPSMDEYSYKEEGIEYNCNLLADYVLLLKEAAQILKERGKITREGKKYTDLNDLFKTQLKVSIEDSDIDNEKDFRRNLEYLENEKWKQFLPVLQLLADEWDEIYQLQCKD
ncbi:MAG: hypothetical protein GY754_31370 [bacterium]|nr:hypothetical protein [bacterium]